MQLDIGKPTLADVDGREPGRAFLLSIKTGDPFKESPDQMYECFEEADGDKYDPIRTAEGLKLSIEGDFPNRHWAIVGNHRAHYLAWRRRMDEMGLGFSEERLSPQAYLDNK